MIAYFDTSGLLPLLIEEPGSQRAARVWDAVERVASVRLIYAEGRAALARAARVAAFEPARLPAVVSAFDRLYEQLDLIDANDRLVRRAGQLAERFALRGYDAVHLATAEMVADETTTLVAGDRDLCGAARALGISVTDTAAS